MRPLFAKKGEKEMPVWMIVLCALAVGCAIGALILRAQLRSFSRTAFGTDSFREGLERQQQELAETPKSLSAMTKVYLPQITRDFPEFDWPEMRERAENIVRSWLAAVDAKNAACLSEGSAELREELRQLLCDQEASDTREHFQKVRVHGCEIARYRRENGVCAITMQVGLESIHTVEENRKVVRGRSDLKEQSIWETEAAYVQIRDTVGSLDGAVGIRCPSCGAPVTNLGAKHCEYCGGAVAALNIRAWQFQNVKNTEA